MKLNQKIVDGLDLPAGKKAVIFWDEECPGLGARLQGTARRWIVRYRVAGNPKQKQVTLGPMAGMPLRKAREAAVEYTGAAKRGVDRAAAEIAEAEEAHRLQRSRADGRLGLIVDRYLQHAETHLRPSTFKETRRYLAVAWQPLHDDVVTELDTRTIIARLETIATDSGPVTANRARSALSQCMSWAVARGIIHRNPLIGTRAIAAEKPRERVLSNDEIVKLWAETGRPGDFAAIIRLLLLTGQRREEVAAMRWSEIDLERRLWEIPSTRTKNGRPHQVPLSNQAAEILRGLHRQEGRDLVFGTGKGGFSGFGQSKRRMDRRITERRARHRMKTAGMDKQAIDNALKEKGPLPEDGLQPWRIHDLRRTAVTGMAEIGIQPHVIEAVVNHISGHKGGVAGIYNRASYADEKRRALQVWADAVEAIVVGKPSPSNVVAINAASA